MGYWGSIVIARTDGSLAGLEVLRRFGHQHRWARQLGDGWQLVETTGWDDPPELAAATGALAAATEGPALAAYVSDGDCAHLCGTAPTGAAWSAHMPDVTQPCGAYLHRPVPAGRGLDEVLADLAGWAAAAGLSPRPDRLRQIVGYEHPQPNGGADVLTDYLSADDQVFELVEALGFERISATLPYAFAIEERPFLLITGPMGLGEMARSRAAFRDHARERGEPVDPEQAWEAEAIRLDHDLWERVYESDVDVSELAARVAAVVAGHREASADPDAELDSGPAADQQSMIEAVFAGLSAGTLQPTGTADFSRRLADLRVRPSPPRRSAPTMDKAPVPADADWRDQLPGLRRFDVGSPVFPGPGSACGAQPTMDGPWMRPRAVGSG